MAKKWGYAELFKTAKIADGTEKYLSISEEVSNMLEKEKYTRN